MTLIRYRLLADKNTRYPFKPWEMAWWSWIQRRTRAGIAPLPFGTGPMRTVVPLTASIFAMPMLLFQTATIASAFVWAFIMLSAGAGLTVSTK